MILVDNFFENRNLDKNRGLLHQRLLANECKPNSL